MYKKRRTTVTMFAGSLLALSLAFTSLAAPVPEESLPMAEVDVSEVQEGDGSFSRQLLYTTYDQDGDAKKHLPETVTANGETYKLASAESQLVVEREDVVPDTKEVTGEEFREGDTGHEPDAAIKDADGVELRLVTKELVRNEAEARTERREIKVDYTGLEGSMQVPDKHEADIDDAVSGQTVKAELSLEGSEVTKEYWSDDFTFPITISGYDADLFYLGDAQIPKDADLADYADAFLDYLGLDSSAYEIQSIEWDGEPFEQDGQLMRTAVGKGRKLMRDVQATYAGDVELPPVATQHWECTYEEVIPEDMKTLYTMTVNATYELQQAAVVEEKSWLQKAAEAVIGLITAAYEAVAASFEEHPVASSIPVVLAAGLIAFFVIKKRKNPCLYDEKTKCPYRKRGKDTCKTCLHYQNRQQIT